MKSTKAMLLLLLATAGASSGCKLLHGRPSPEGLTEVKSVAKGADEWKDTRGGLWRIQTKEKLDWEDANAYCTSLAAQTKKRWRLPSPEELTEARTEGISSGKNAAFGWVKLGNTWAAEWETTISEDVSGVYIDMDTGTKVSTVYDDLEHTTVCVRTDNQGVVWNDGKGKQWWYLEVKMEWETAEVTCAELANRRHEPWRLPAPDEVTEAIKNGIQTEKNKAFGRDYLNFVWTASVAPILDSEQAYAVDLRNGRAHLTDVDEDLAVVCAMQGAATAPSTASNTSTGAP
jgi:hypothetical protein